MKKCISKEDLEQGIQNYNNLLDIVYMMVQENVDIPIREMSVNENAFALDKTKVLELPKIVIK